MAVGGLVARGASGSAESGERRLELVEGLVPTGTVGAVLEGVGHRLGEGVDLLVGATFEEGEELGPDPERALVGDVRLLVLLEDTDLRQEGYL